MEETMSQEETNIAQSEDEVKLQEDNQQYCIESILYVTIGVRVCY